MPIAPKDNFLYGVATSAAQIEGAAWEDGRLDSIWDVFARKKGKIKDRSHPSPGCDHYHLWQKDVENLVWLGVNAYRFSLSWSRLIPLGRGELNPKGVSFYQRLLAALRKNDIRPYVTLYHWDLPQSLEDKGGWTNRDITSWFVEYAHKVDKALGEFIDSYIILNEPLVFTALGYLLGIHAPGRRGLANFLKAMHHALLAQAEAARAIRDQNKQVRLGTSISCVMGYPYRQQEKDLRALARFDALMNRLFVDPVVGRGYPTQELPVLKKAERYFAPQDLEKICFDFDFWGINSYTTKLVKYAWYVPYVHYREIRRDLPRTEMDWEIEPQGIYDLLKKFGSYPEIKEILISENGAAFYDEVIGGKIYDFRRINYLKQHLAMVEKARQEGVPVRGYFVWSLMDNFEWAEGFRMRFGLFYVNYETKERLPKESAWWYRELIRGNT